jgi:hypothetical protein
VCRQIAHSEKPVFDVRAEDSLSLLTRSALGSPPAIIQLQSASVRPQRRATGPRLREPEAAGERPRQRGPQTALHCFVKEFTTVRHTVKFAPMHSDSDCARATPFSLYRSGTVVLEHRIEPAIPEYPSAT